MKLEGINNTIFAPTTKVFDLDTNINTNGKPVGLIDGDTNFYVTGGVGQSGSPLSSTKV